MSNAIEDEESLSPAEDISLQLEILNELKTELQKVSSIDPGQKEALERVQRAEKYLQEGLRDAKAADETLLQFACGISEYLDVADPVEQKRRAAYLEQPLHGTSQKDTWRVNTHRVLA